MSNLVEALQRIVNSIPESSDGIFNSSELLQETKEELLRLLLQTSKVNESQAQGIVTADTAYWRNPDLEPPPIGTKLTVISWGSVQMEAQWTRDANEVFAAWAPLIKKPPWLIDRLNQHYRRNIRDSN